MADSHHIADSATRIDPPITDLTMHPGGEPRRPHAGLRV